MAHIGNKAAPPVESPQRKTKYSPALLVLAVGAILYHTSYSALQLWEPDPSPSGRCVYQLYVEGVFLATYFVDHEESIDAILKRSSISNPQPTANTSCPCGSRINIGNGAVTSEKMAGATLFAMGKPIDLNIADAADLQAIPGIGPQLAERIVQRRMAYGAFSTVECLSQVRGIGPKKVVAFARYLTVSQPFAPQRH